MDDRVPDTQTSGALVPPPRVPPTAVATSAPLPPGPRRPDGYTSPRRSAGLRGSVQAMLDVALDGLDRVADRIAGAAGLR